MNSRLILPAILGAAMLSTPALAASSYSTVMHPAWQTQKAAAMTPAEKCTALQSQLDAAIKTHEKAAKAADAKAMRNEGGTFCTSGKHAEGVAKLEQALKDLGVKPKA